MPAGQFAEWERYFQVYPFRADMDAAILATLSSIAVNVCKVLGKDAALPSEFLPDHMKPDTGEDNQVKMFLGAIQTVKAFEKTKRKPKKVKDVA